MKAPMKVVLWALLAVTAVTLAGCPGGGYGGGGGGAYPTMKPGSSPATSMSPY